MEKVVLPRNKILKPLNKHQFIISTKVSLSRNIEALSFPNMLSTDEKILIEQKISNSILSIDKDIFSQNIKDIDKSSQQALLSDLVLTEDFIKHGNSYFYKKDGSWIILINTRNHIQIFSIEFGLHLKDIYKDIESVISYLDQYIYYAYDPNFGYLTSSIDLLGNGLKMSVLLNLSGLALQSHVKTLADTCNETGYMLKNFIPDDSSHLFYLKNRNSFGISEVDHINHMVQMLEKIQMAEKIARKELLDDKDNIEFFITQIHQLLNQKYVTYADSIQIITLVELLNNKIYKIMDPSLWQAQIFRLDNYSSYFSSITDSEECSKYRAKILHQIFSNIIKIL